MAGVAEVMRSLSSPSERFYKTLDAPCLEKLQMAKREEALSAREVFFTASDSHLCNTKAGEGHRGDAVKYDRERGCLFTGNQRYLFLRLCDKANTRCCSSYTSHYSPSIYREQDALMARRSTPS